MIFIYRFIQDCFIWLVDVDFFVFSQWPFFSINSTKWRSLAAYFNTVTPPLPPGPLPPLIPAPSSFQPMFYKTRRAESTKANGGSTLRLSGPHSPRYVTYYIPPSCVTQNKLCSILARNMTVQCASLGFNSAFNSAFKRALNGIFECWFEGCFEQFYCMFLLSLVLISLVWQAAVFPTSNAPAAVILLWPCFFCQYYILGYNSERAFVWLCITVFIFIRI